jgi:DNA-binding LytR/AlgR family response regulator
MSDDKLLLEVSKAAFFFWNGVVELQRRGFSLARMNLSFSNGETGASELTLTNEMSVSESEIEKFKLKISGFNIEHLLYIQTDENYILLHLIPQEDVKFSRKQKSILSTMKAAMSYLTKKGFVRVNRFFAVNLRYAHYAHSVIKLDNGEVFKIADSYRDDVEKAFGVKNEDKK